MTMHSSGTGSQVWVGNIPFDVTEEELRELMSTAGHVLSIRVVYDKDSGQSRGFAFCEYRDIETCTLAIKNLNGTEIRNRNLRVDWATQEMKNRYGTQMNNQSNQSLMQGNMNLHNNQMGQNNNANSLSNQCNTMNTSNSGNQNAMVNNPGCNTMTSSMSQSAQGNINMKNNQSGSSNANAISSNMNNPSTQSNMSQKLYSNRANVNNQDMAQQKSALYDSSGNLLSEISQLVQTMSVSQLYYLLGHMQKLIVESPDTARSILNENPQLCYALLHAQFLVGMIDEQFIPLKPHELQEADHIRKERLREIEKNYSNRDINNSSSNPLQYSGGSSRLIRYENTNFSEGGFDYGVASINSLLGDVDQLVNEIINNPNQAIIDVLSSINPENIPQWSNEEKSKILTIQQALRNHGLLQ